MVRRKEGVPPKRCTAMAWRFTVRLHPNHRICVLTIRPTGTTAYLIEGRSARPRSMCFPGRFSDNNEAGEVRARRALTERNE